MGIKGGGGRRRRRRGRRRRRRSPNFGKFCLIRRYSATIFMCTVVITFTEHNSEKDKSTEEMHLEAPYSKCILGIGTET